MRLKNLLAISLLLITSTCYGIKSIILTPRQLCDIELLMNGGFAPLTGFMNRADYNSVVENMHLADGSLWPMPITLDVSQKVSQTLQAGDTIALQTPEFVPLCNLTITDIWEPDKLKEAQNVYGTTNTDHPGVDYLINQTGQFYIGGNITPIRALKKHKLHYDFTELRKTPAELKQYFKDKGHEKVVAFQTRNPMHRAHYELTRRAAEQQNAHLLIHPVVGMTKPGDVDYFTRIRCYKQLLNYYPEGMTTLSLLPVAMRMSGPREAVWHALIRKNYGCTHFIVGRDHAGPGTDRNGNDFYGPYDAQKLVQQYANEIGITIVPFQEMVYVERDDAYYTRDEAPKDAQILTISGTQFRAMLKAGKPIPEWFSYPEVVSELQKTYPPSQKQGITLFFTGLSGAGKSTITNALAMKLMEIQNRKLTILDGDQLRTHLSQELGFSKEHRSINVRRVGYVASEITKNGGITLCALIAPYEADRMFNRGLITQYGAYLEIYVSTPLPICEDRDPKGLYEKAREGIIQQFTGISDPYEVPNSPEIVIDTTDISVEECVDHIISYLKQTNYI